MKDNFKQALAAVLKHEGGYVNHPKDPGGATNKGIIQTTYDSARKRWGYSTRSVKFITDDEVALIYRTMYWDAVAGDDLPSGVDYAMFDFAVNSGPYRAIRSVQLVLNILTDGKMGPVTLNAIKAQPPARLITSLCDYRMAFLRGLSHWPTFGKGWSSRVVGVRRLAAELAYGARTEAPEVPATTLPPLPEKPVLDDPRGSQGLWNIIITFILKLFGK